MRILLVEDDAMVGHGIREGLKQEGHAVDWVRDGQSAEHALVAQPYSLVILDLGLPKRDGLEVLAWLRAKGIDAPVLIITARDAVADRVRGLDSGADDYLVKPFDLDELAARVRSLGRRHAGRAAPVISHGPLTLNPATRQAWWCAVPVQLSNKEFALLQALLDRPGAVLSRAQLEERLYGWNEEVESNAVEVYIYNLRRKLSSDFIRNVRGVGYMIVKPT